MLWLSGQAYYKGWSEILIKKTTSITFRVEENLIDKLNSSITKNNFGTVSDALKHYIELGMLAESFKTEVQNPDFLKSIDELKQSDGLFQWVETLTENQKDALSYALKQAREVQYEQARLR